MNGVKKLFQDIADTIRQMSGSTQALSPSNFCNEIKKLPTASSLINKTITKYNFLNENVVVPDYAFYNCNQLKEVNWPSVTSIGNSAFYGCASLTELNNLDNLTSISSNAFQKAGLTSITIPSGVKEISGHAFRETPLSSVTFSEGLETINSYAFSSCNFLSSIVLPTTCTTVQSFAFLNSSITTLDGYLTSIAGSAFKETNLKTLILQSSEFCTLANIAALKGTPIDKGEGYIYVPEALLSQYQGDTIWGEYINQIKPISELPPQEN